MRGVCDSKRRRVRESSRVSQIYIAKKKDFTYKLFRQQNENKMWLMSCVIFFCSPSSSLAAPCFLLLLLYCLEIETFNCLQNGKN